MFALSVGFVQIVCASVKGIKFVDGLFCLFAGCAMHYDSLEGGNQLSSQKAARAFQKLRSELPSWKLPARLRAGQLFVQTNSYDCGVFVWLTMETLWRKHCGWPNGCQGDLLDIVSKRRQYLNRLSATDMKLKETALETAGQVS